MRSDHYTATVPRQSEILLRYQSVLLNQLHDSIIVTNLDGAITFWNDVATRTLGWTSEEMLGRHILNRIPAADLPEAERLLETVRSGNTHAGRYRCMHKDSRHVWLDVKLSLIHDENGHHIGMMGVCRNITEEKASHDNLQLKHAIVRRSRDNIIVTEAEPVEPPGPRIVYVSPSLIRDTGYSEEELIGQTPRIFQGPKTDRAALVRIRNSLKNWQPIREELVNYRKDGSEFWVELDITPLADETGWYTHWVAIQRDITERKLAEQNLQARERHLKAIIEGSPDCIKVLDADGTVRKMNAAGLKMLGGATLDMVLGQKAITMVVPEDREKYEEFHRRVIAGTPGMLEFRIRQLSGAVRLMECHSVPLELYDGRVHLSFSLDITERRRMEVQMRQSQKLEAIGQLAGGIAHDFNNLLMVVKGTSELLLLDLPESDPNRVMIESICHAGERGAALTRQLLTFSREAVVQLVVFDPAEKVKESLKMLVRLLGEDIVVEYLGKPLSGRLRADPGQFDQILMNLIVNARDAMPRGGKITVETGIKTIDATDYLLLCVRDTGNGISPDARDRLFEPFFTTKPPGHGTGLGLATVDAIVRQYHGFIHWDSVPGEGTEFRVLLPLVAEAADETPDTRMKSFSAAGNETILLVEDDNAVKVLLNGILERFGYLVLTAESAETAMDMFDTLPHPPHLVITDVVMSGKSGQSLAEEIRIRHPEMKFLFLSGYTNDRTLAYGLSRDRGTFLQKPVSPEDLARAVRGMLDE